MGSSYWGGAINCDGVHLSAVCVHCATPMRAMFRYMPRYSADCVCTEHFIVAITVMGGLFQLVAYGTGGVHLWAQSGSGHAIAANMRDSMMHWFVERPDGFPIQSDLEINTGSILHANEHTEYPVQVHGPGIARMNATDMDALIDLRTAADACAASNCDVLQSPVSGNAPCRTQPD